MIGAVFVGRSEEIERGRRAVETAERGEGALVAFTGEAGIGKTRLADAVASIAAQNGARVAWGRCWEAGGAPAYWPWIQIFRALGLDDEVFGTDEHVAGNVDARNVRFRQFDRAVAALKKAATESVLVIVLDDLHMADVPSLLLLQFLARALRGTKILAICTYRDAEARLVPEVGAALAKIAREGDAMAVRRLSKDDVLAWLRTSAPNADDALAERVHKTTEGNALFVHELLRVRGTPGEGDLPDGLRAVLDEHLARVAPEVRSTLEIASVLGRDVDPRAVAVLAGAPVGTIEEHLRAAHESGLLTSPAGGNRLAFAHILVRERLYSTLAPTRRAGLHEKAGEHVLETKGDLATAAHHFAEARSKRAAETLLAAGRAANGKLAFEDASRLAMRGLEMLEGATEREELAVACDLEMLLGETLLREGSSDAGKEACVRANARAKAIGDAERQARTALAFSTEMLSGVVDDRMVLLLGDALEALPPGDSALRARVIARHAASLVPPKHLDQVPGIKQAARDSVAMAERVGDAETRFYVMRFASSALGYLVTTKDRWEHAEKMALLIDELHRPIEFLNVGCWIVCTRREQGRIAEADAMRERIERVAADFPQPHYQWRLPMLRSNFALLRGDIAEAERLGKEAFDTDPTSVMCRMHYALHRFGIAHVGDDPGRIAAEPIFERLVTIGAGAMFRAWRSAAFGDHDGAARNIEELLLLPGHFIGILLAGEAARLLGDRALAERIYPALAQHARDNMAFWASHGALFFGPTERIAGEVAAMLGKTEEARAHFEEAIRICERMQALPFLEKSKRGLAALGGPSSKRPERRPEQIAITKDGEMWHVTSSAGVSFRLKDAKGLQYLSDLLARPGQELHVTQLAELADEFTGDAGPVLDAKAKDAYKRKLEDLRDELEEANRFGDQRRAERAQEQIDALADQLSAAVGLGGRDRKVGSHVERARINVQRRLKDAIQRIEEQDSALGKYLFAAVKTGTYCSFTPF